MSDYIQPGAGFYGGNQRLPTKKSVYYPAPSAAAANQQQQQPQQLGQQQQLQGGAGQLPSGAIPVFSNIETAPGVKLLSFHQEVTASLPPQLQQQLQQQQALLQQPRQQQPQQAYGGAPTLVNSDYAAAGWGAQQYATPIRVVNQQPQPQQQAEFGAENAALQQAQSEYEQAMAMAQRAAERLGQLNGGLTPQVQYSGFGAQASAAAAAAPTQSQVRFGGAQRIPTPTNSSYRFEDAAAQSKPAPKFNQGQAESVYIGMPNNLYLAANRPQEYHFAPQQQERVAYRHPSNINLQTARENDASNTNLRRMLSEENVRTAILNDDAGNVIGFVQTRSAAAPQGPAAAAGGQHQQQHLQGGSSDYHFDALRGLNSAY